MPTQEDKARQEARNLQDIIDTRNRDDAKERAQAEKLEQELKNLKNNYKKD